ncbi:hypothetical protein IKD67_01415 [Candidatus Saccharibacteria bacterium]|nr:hypothetical protein [Candidatus Saccharibacteria bacterium]
MKIRSKFKKGAASFYIVAFSTLILMIVAISFAAVIISEVERTSNDDLSQSAYDSALAGIEDAKLAYSNYQNCLTQEGVSKETPNNNGIVTCGEIMYYMDKANDDSAEEDCAVVWKILGKSDEDGNKINGEIVEAKSDASGNNMQQETTCLTMTDVLDGYSGTLSTSNMLDVIRLKFTDDVDVNEISHIKLKWFSKNDAIKALGNNKDAKFVFKQGFPASSVPVAIPPVVSLTILQTGPRFTMSSFDKVNKTEGAEKTNRGSLYFIPKDGNASDNIINKNALVKSNDKTVSNNPYNVNCAKSVGEMKDDFACSVMMELPSPIDGPRNSDTFQAIVSYPYGQPPTEFRLELFCANGALCGTEEKVNNDNGLVVAKMKGVQLEVDSTGRANDLYRRVLVTLKSKNDLALSVMGPLELLDADDGNDSAGMKKTLTVTQEYNFNP